MIVQQVHGVEHSGGGGRGYLWRRRSSLTTARGPSALCLTHHRVDSSRHKERVVGCWNCVVMTSVVVCHDGMNPLRIHRRMFFSWWELSAKNFQYEEVAACDARVGPLRS